MVQPRLTDVLPGAGRPSRRVLSRCVRGRRATVLAALVMALALTCGAFAGPAVAASPESATALPDIPTLAALGPVQAAAGGPASVTITPASTTTPSGASVTYTLTVSCSVTGGCTGTTVSFPSTAITGDGSTTDFASWVGGSSCPGVTKTASGGTVTFTYGTVPTGTSQCTFNVSPPEYTTFNGTQVTITPTISGSNFSSDTGSPAALTVTAGHNDSLDKSAPSQVGVGGTYSYTLTFRCGSNSYTGDVGLSGLSVTDVLPANFTYSSSSATSPTNVAMPGSLSYNAGTRTLTYSDPSGASCRTPPLKTNEPNTIVITVTGTPATNGSPDPVGSLVCNTASSTFTYLDGTPGSSTSPQVCPQVVSLSWNTTKDALATTLGNVGQYMFPGSSTRYPYTYPGNWDGTGTSSEFDVKLFNSTQATNAGLAYTVQDPLPCLDNLSSSVYSSNASPGAPYCANPAFVPTRVLAQGFTPTAADVITVVFSDATTQTVPYTGPGWVIPTSKPVAELDFAAFPEEGSNFGNIAFRIQGYAASTTTTTSLLRNTATVNAYQVGSSTAIGNAQQPSGNLLVVSATAPSGTVVYPSLSSFNNGSCTENVELNNVANGVLANYLEVASVPSGAFYVDYLAPAGATGINAGWTGVWKLVGLTNGKTFSTASLSPTATGNFNGTGRTRYEWVIPAGTATTGGLYRLDPPNRDLRVSLPLGCAGTYQNDVTVGYGAPITSCIFNNAVTASRAQTPPLNPASNSDLNSNGAPSTGNYCGYSAPLTVPATNPGFSVDKSVQGNLDGSPVGAGGTGHVSPSGGTATYNVTFTNTGQANLTNPVMYDILPAVGDTQASSLTTRGSQFKASLTSVGTLPAGVTAYYSQSSNPCRPEVLSSNPGCVNDWSTTPPSPLSSAKALKFVYSGTVVVSGAPGTHSFTVPYTVSTPPGASGTAWNTVGTNATGGQGGSLIGAAESSRTGLAAQGAPAIVKATSTPSYAKPGDPISYTFTVTNNTTVPVSGVAVTDNLVGAAAGDVAPTATCQSLSSPSGSCSGATTALQPGQSAVFAATASATQGDVDQGSIADTATVTANPPTGGALSNTSNKVTVNAAQSAGLSLAKSADPTTFTAGQTVAYSYVVSNTGNVSLTSVRVRETAFTGSGTAPSPSCPGTSLAAGAKMTCTATYTVTQADMDAGSVSNTAEAVGNAPSGSQLASLPSTAKVTALRSDLEVLKTASPTPAVAGTDETYTVKVTNHGPSAASNVSVSDQLPSGLSFVSASTGCANANGTVTCTTASLAADASTSFTIKAHLASSVDSCDDIRNTATVTSSMADPDPSNNSSTVCPLVKRRANLSLSKTPSSGQVAHGGQVMYTLIVKNDGPSVAANATVTDRMPSGLSLVSAKPSQGSCSTAGGDVSCDMGTLQVGGSAQVLVTATVTAPAGSCGADAIENTASTSSDSQDPDTDDNEDSASICTTPDPAPSPPPPPSSSFDLAVAKTAASKSVYVGQPITYTVTVTNKGPAAAPNAKVTDTLNNAASVASVNASQGSCTKAIPMTCQLGEVGRGGKVTITVKVKLRDSGCRERNAASATGAGTDANPADNLATVDVCAKAVPLRLTKVADSPWVRAGGTVGYTIGVSNPSAGEAKEVQVCDKLPSGLVYLSSKARARFTAGQYCWTIQTLRAHKHASFRITVRALGSASGDRVNRATASAKGARTRHAKDPIRVLAARATGGGVTG